ncbi:MAG: hypothetical protein HY240_00925 [Actinobacteria bacterium]|nr:hypothetical protein [Actinomycetota bacterium]
MVPLVWFPAPSVAVTVKSYVPAVEVSIAEPDGTGPAHEARPEPPSSAHE